jgi:hypothetical protein
MVDGSDPPEGPEEPEDAPVGDEAATAGGGGPQAEHLREILRERFGDVPPESPTEPPPEAGEDLVEPGDEGADAEASDPLEEEAAE